VASSLGGLGIPATTSKYMAEFIGMGDRGTARYIYFRTLLLQVCLATVATAGIVIWILHDAPADYRIAAVLVVLSIWPSMVNSISSMANMATENLATNLPASIVSTIVYALAIGASIVMHWGVVGIGAALFLMRAVDFLVRLFPTMKRILSWERTHVQPAGLRNRMISFAWQSVTTMVVSLIVWERSEVFLLKPLCPDIRQISYYSVAFSMAERLLVVSMIFGSGNRDDDLRSVRARQVASSTDHCHDISLPGADGSSTALHRSISGSASLAFASYGRDWVGASAVATLAPLLCLCPRLSSVLRKASCRAMNGRAS
jgi:O-antigen/teichoic acid export membrane protein